MKSFLFSLSLSFIGLKVVFAGATDFSSKKVYPEFAVGISGLYAVIEKGKVKVTRTEPGTPAHNKFAKGEYLLSVNGKS